jgi:hypothetical protein
MWRREAASKNAPRTATGPEAPELRIDSFYSIRQLQLAT